MAKTKASHGAGDTAAQKAKSDAWKNNAKEVRLIEGSGNFVDSKGLVAGYLNLASTDELTTLLADEGLAAPLRAMEKSADEKFGIATTRGVTVTTKRCLDWLRESAAEAAPAWKTLSVPLPLDSEHQGHERAFITYAITMHEIITHCPNPKVFVDQATPTRHLYHGHTMEDWNRAERLIRFNRRVRSKEAAVRGGAEVDTPTAGRKRSAQVKTPSFLTDEDLLALEHGSAAITTPQDVAAAGASLAQGDDRLVAYDRTAWFHDHGDPTNVSEEDFDRLLTAMQDQGSMSHQQGRPSLTPDQQEQTCRAIGRRVRLQWPIPIKDLTVGQQLVPTTAAKAWDYTAVPQDQRVERRRLDAEREALAPELAPEETDRKQQQRIRQEQQYRTLQEALNRYNATTPSYAVACQRLQIQPNDPCLPHRPTTDMDKTPSPKKLLSHQVRFIAWALDRERSKLPAWILADDMGLGKTLTTLSLIVFAFLHRPGDVLQPGGPSPGTVTDGRRQRPMPTTTTESAPASGNEIATEAVTDGRPEAPRSRDPATSAADAEESDEEGSGADDEDDAGAKDTTTSNPETPHPGTPAATTPRSARHIHPRNRKLSAREKYTGGLQLRDRLAPDLARARAHEHKPVLIVTATNGIGVWADEARNLPDLQVFLFHGGGRKRGRRADGNKIIGKKITGGVSSLMKTLATRPDEPSNLLTIVCTTYHTWAHRSVYLDSKGAAAGVEAQLGGDEEVDEDDEDGDGGRAASKSLSAEQARAMTTYFPGCFSKVVLDESQHIKNPHTLMHISIRDLQAPKINMLSATPMLNRPVDLEGALQLLARPDWSEALDFTEAEACSLEEYEAAKQKLDQRDVPLAELESFFPILNPVAFRQHATTQGMTDNSMSPLVAASVLSAIACLIQVRRTAASPLEDGSCIGDRIPPATWQTVELQNPDEHAVEYGHAHAAYAPKLNIGYDEEAEEGLIHVQFHRWLCLLTAGLALQQIVLNPRDSRSGLQATFAKYADHGASFYFMMTRARPEHPNYQDRIGMAWWLCAYSVKLRALIDMTYDICAQHRRRLLVFCDWPVTQWFVEMALLNMGFPTWSIRASHSTADREGTVSAFKDPGRADIQVLVTSTRIAATAYNLQDCCSDLIFFDVPSNSQTKLQAGGRLIRLGQRERVHLWTLTVDHTYDQCLQAKATQKMLGIIAGQAELTLTDADRAAGVADLEADDTVDLEEKVVQTAQHERAVSLKAAGYYQEIFGERSSRWRWDGLTDLTVKDLLAVEFKFRAQHKLPEDPFLWPTDRKEAEASEEGKKAARRRAEERRQIRREYREAHDLPNSESESEGPAAKGKGVAGDMMDVSDQDRTPGQSSSQGAPHTPGMELAYRTPASASGGTKRGSRAVSPGSPTPGSASKRPRQRTGKTLVATMNRDAQRSKKQEEQQERAANTANLWALKKAKQEQRQRPPRKSAPGPKEAARVPPKTRTQRRVEERAAVEGEQVARTRSAQKRRAKAPLSEEMVPASESTADSDSDDLSDPPADDDDANDPE